MRRLRDGEWIAAAGGLALIASLFLHWYRAEVRFGALDRPFRTELTGWQALAILDVVLVALALVPLAAAVLQATRESPALPVAFTVFSLLAGLLAALLILYRIANQPGENAFVGVEAGAWLGFAAGLVIAGGAWRSLRVEPIPGAPLAPVRDLPAPS